MSEKSNSTQPYQSEMKTLLIQNNDLSEEIKAINIQFTSTVEEKDNQIKELGEWTRHQENVIKELNDRNKQQEDIIIELKSWADLQQKNIEYKDSRIAELEDAINGFKEKHKLLVGAYKLIKK